MPLSGPTWVALFPGSRRVDDLVEPFRTQVQDFLAALDQAGAEVEIAATLRPPERAHLMHFSFQIAHGQIEATAVPAMDGVDIEWVHSDEVGGFDRDASVAAAAAMVEGYAIVFAPVLASQHTRGLAIDMNISWAGDLTIVDKNGLETTISTLPRSGGNADLQAVAETFGIFKLATDPPHWSSDGH